MQYEAQNYGLLEQLCKEFSLYFGTARVSGTLDYEVLVKAYQPHSNIEVDEVANAICWCVETLQALLADKSVRCVDEVLSFTASVLERRIA